MLLKPNEEKKTMLLLAVIEVPLNRAFSMSLPPANEVCEGYVFTGVCLSTRGGGMHGCSGGRAWLLRGGVRGCSGGGMRGCSRGAYVAAPGGCAWLLLGGHVWLLRGGMHGCPWGVCVVAPGGACVVAQGACVVALGGHAWLLRGGHVWLLGGACVVAPRGGAWFFRGGMRGFFHEIRSMSGRYASYWNAFLFVTNFDTGSVHIATRYTWSTNIEVPFLAEYLDKRKI